MSGQNDRPYAIKRVSYRGHVIGEGRVLCTLAGGREFNHECLGTSTREPLDDITPYARSGERTGNQDH